MNDFSHEAIRREVRERALCHLAARWLNVDYYRIRRRLAFPLPLKELPTPEIDIRGIAHYPWDIWFLWAFEERFLAIGWHAQWSGDEEARNTLLTELEALLTWPRYLLPDTALLAPTHTVRLFLTALQWSFPSPGLKEAILHSLARLTDELLPRLTERYEGISSADAILESSDHLLLLANIPVIGLCAASMAAEACRHPRASWLHERLEWVMEALRLRRAQDASEGVAYDGYILDFIWDAFETGRYRLEGLPEVSADVLRCAIALGAPGDSLALAELSDVEPVEMRFYLSAIAKHRARHPTGDADGFFAPVGLDALRVDTLVALSRQSEIDPCAKLLPPVKFLDARYAVVLRSGWKAGDTAMAIGCNHWKIGHLHRDFGSVCLGTAGRWFVTDAGYQQYMATSERAFTLEASAHNTPVINGHFQTLKPARRNIAHLEDGTHGFRLDLTECYSSEAKVSSCKRTFRLLDDGSMEVLDEIEAQGCVTYCWLAPQDAAWMISNGSISIILADVALEVRLDNYHLNGGHLTRPRGSRNMQAITTEHPFEGSASFRWRFAWR